MSRFFRIAAGSLVIGLLLLLGYAGYSYFSLERAYTELTTEHKQLATQFAETEAQRNEAEQHYEQQKATTTVYQEQLKGTVETLETLTKTDKELLQKYSKIYFLNENYIPSELSAVPGEFVVGNDEELHTEVLPFFEALVVAADADNISLKIVSGYRSFGTQATLKGAYLRKYGTGANSFSADQGYSEHQLGTAIDFTTEQLGTKFTSFGSDSAYTWLLDNGYRYGFILSYPKGNTAYQFEPWHWRFVGVELATYLHEHSKYFYELDQREIDPYLLKVFALLPEAKQ